jgi:hypothetical protein
MVGCQKIAPVLLLALLAAGCSSTPSFDAVEFEQWVADNASKRFIFSVPFGNPSGDLSSGRQSAGDAEDLLEDYMSAINYCSDGYFVYARNFSGRRYNLEGECQEPSD